MFPDRTYDTCPTIMWTSKAIYVETSDVFYRENMLVRVTVQAFGLGDDFNLVDRLLNDTMMGAFTGAGEFIDFNRSLAACKLHAMDVEITRVKGLEECGRVEDVQLMIPASQLYHVVTLLHSLLVAGWRDEHFGDAHKLILKVRNKYGMSEELAFQRLLAPFRGLYAMRRAKIIGMKRTPHIKWLQSCLSHTDRWSSYTDQDMHKWLRQVAKLFFITYQQYKHEEVGVAARDAWNEVICNIDLGCTQLVSDLWPNEQVLLHRILFWSKLKKTECEFDLMMQSEEADPSDIRESTWDELYMDYFDMLARCAHGLPMKGMEGVRRSVSKDALWPEKHILLLYHEWIDFCLYRGLHAQSRPYVGRCKKSTFYNNEFDYELDESSDSVTSSASPEAPTILLHGPSDMETSSAGPQPHTEPTHDSSDSDTSSAGTESSTVTIHTLDFIDPNTGRFQGPTPQTDFVDGKLQPEEWVGGSMEYWTRPYQESSPEPATDKDENEDDSD